MDTASLYQFLLGLPFEETLTYSAVSKESYEIIVNNTFWKEKSLLNYNEELTRPEYFNRIDILDVKFEENGYHTNERVIIGDVIERLKWIEKVAQGPTQVFIPDSESPDESQYPTAARGFKICPLAKSITVGYALLGFMRILIENDPSLIRAHVINATCNTKSGLTITKVIRSLIGWENVYGKDLPLSDKLFIRIALDDGNIKSLTKNLSDFDIYTLSRIADEVSRTNFRQ